MNNKKKILIVDDAKFMQKITSAMLYPDYECVCASNGIEALEVFDRENPDLVITDLIMPQMTGLELQKRLQERRQDPVPVMFMTADVREETENRSLANGAMDYIRKPFTRELLRRHVENVMRQIERIEGLKIVAETDPMTGLYNKAMSAKVLTEICSHQVGTLIMLDLDSFKLVNDIYGHDMGDRVLIRFSEILRSVIRTSDIAGRVGGDEFIAFCKDVQDESVIAEKCRVINRELTASAKALMGEDMNIPLGACMGCVRVPEGGTVYTELYQKADKALYEVKQNGKHGFAFYSCVVNAEESEQTEDEATSLENVCMILDERNRPKGAFYVGFENFRSIYRYQVRCIENHQSGMELALFTVTALDRDYDLEQAVDTFGEVLRSSLRRTDVVTKSGRHQYMALLTYMDNVDRQIILKRIQTQWEATDIPTEHFDVSCSACLIDPASN